MVVDKLEMVETRNRNLEDLLAESEKREELRNDRETEMQARISLLESRLDRCEKSARVQGAGWVDGEPDEMSCQPLSDIHQRQPSWPPDRDSAQDEDSLPEESTHVDTSGFLCMQLLRAKFHIEWFPYIFTQYTCDHFNAVVMILQLNATCHNYLYGDY